MVKFQIRLFSGINILRKFKTSKQLYKEAKINVQKLIKNKKGDFYQEKLRGNVGKPKEEWKALKSIGLPSSLSNFFQRWEKISFDEKTHSRILMLI